MKSKGYDNSDMLQVLNALNDIIRRYTKPRYPQLRLEHVIYAMELMAKYEKLTFFDSIHASIAILNNLVYYDLNDVVKTVVNEEVKEFYK